MARKKLLLVVDEVRPLKGYKMTLGDVIVNIDLNLEKALYQQDKPPVLKTPIARAMNDSHELGAALGYVSWATLIKMSDDDFDTYIQTLEQTRKLVRKVEGLK